MGYKFVVTGQIIPHEIGAVVEFDEMPHEGMLRRLKAVEGSELVVATPQAEPEAEVIEQAEPEVEKQTRGGKR